MRQLLQLCLLFHSCILLGQSQLQFDHLQLPNSARALCMLQDSKGFIWFGTDAGLLRFDGYEFKEFGINPYDSLSLQTGKTFILLEDFEGYLWMNSFQNGLYKFDPITEHFHFYSDNANDSTLLKSSEISSMLEDSENRLWIGTRRGGLHLYDRDNNSFINFYHETDSVDRYVNSINEIFEFKPGVFWLLTFAGFIEFTPESGSWKLMDYRPSYHSRFYRDYQDRIWTSDPSLQIFEPKSEKFVPFQPSNQIRVPNINVITGDRMGRLFLGTFDATNKNQDGGGGLAILDVSSRIIKLDAPRINDPHSLNDGSVQQLMVDRSGILWASHSGMSGSANYVEKYDSKKHIKHYVNYLPELEQTTDLVVNTTQIDANDSNIIWIGTLNNGLIKFNRLTGESQQFLYDPDKPGAFGWPYAIYSIFQDRFGILWIGSWSSGLYKLNPETGEWKNYKDKFIDHGLQWSWRRIGSIQEDSESNLWVGCLGDGLNKLKLDDGVGFDREILSYEHIDPISSNSRRYVHGQVGRIDVDRFNKVWFSTGNGLFRYIPERDDFDKFLEIGQIWNVFHDSQGNLWVGTLTGLFKADLSRSRLSETDSIEFKRFDIASELIGSSVALGFEDKNGYLWGVLENNLIKYDPTRGNYTLYNEGDGVMTQGFALGAHFINGLLAIPGNNGFIVFSPDSLKENSFIPPVVITDFQLGNRSVSLTDSLDGKPVLTKVINHTQKISLPYGQNFGFKFAAINFTNTPKNQYSYKLEGFDQEWSPPSTNRTAIYTNLWEGNYTFIVKGSNNDGVWNQEGTFIQIAITPPMWRTWWAYSLYAMAFLGITFSIFRFFVIRERLKGDLQLEQMELEKVKEMDSMKTQFFANVSHEFRTPLTLILGPLKQMKQGTFKGDVDAVINVMIRNSKRLLHLINQLLDFSKIEAGKMTLRASKGDLVVFIRTIFAAFESTAQSRGLKYILESDLERLMVYYDPDKLEKIIINLLSNAFKFTEEGSVLLKIHHKVDNTAIDHGSGVVRIQVEDTGMGISAEKLPHIFDRFFQADPSHTRIQEGSGIGLALTKELVELHHGSIEVASTPDQGALFSVDLPLGRDHLNESQIVVRAGYQPVETTAIETLPESLDLFTNGEDDADSRPLVLIIDDNQDMRMYVRAAIAEDFRLKEAQNGIKGWESALQDIPDLVISDVMMPKMDGQELCERLKNDQRTSHIPVVLLTAKAGEKAKMEGLETGADDYLTKPFSPDELKVRVKNLIEIRQKLSERYSKDISLKPKDIAITSLDEQFLEKVMEIVEKHRTNTEFGAEDFAREMGMSRSQMHRKLVALTGQTTSDFIRSYRLNYARQLIEKNFGNMTQVAYESGFSSPSYFTVCFKKQFGVAPKEFEKSNPIR
ncbi:MAG: hybrid sensor histidine kinase/response regulator [Cyclobacteriaceae bacterium]|nr:MAG: hybrid sensor histidine kinase/response regulator [Cyclobacteriaceae bacterium]